MIALSQDGAGGGKELGRKTASFVQPRRCFQDCLKTKGFCFQRHDYQSVNSADWSAFSRAECLEICVNLSGCGELLSKAGPVFLASSTIYYLIQEKRLMSGVRYAGERHQFFMVHLSKAFLNSLNVGKPLLPIVERYVRGENCEEEVAFLPMTREIEELVLLQFLAFATPSLKGCWQEEKILQIILQLVGAECSLCTCCSRTQRLTQERVRVVCDILQKRMSNPPTLDELGKAVHCSQYYLSRLFARSQGITIQQYLRKIRLERAAEMLRKGECNVTEATFEVGYNSLSHFSTAFHEMFGCSPAYYAGHRENGVLFDAGT